LQETPPSLAGADWSPDRSDMRRLLAAILLAMLALPATAAAAPVPGCLDGFSSLDPARWTPGDHVLGLSRLRPQGATVAGGALRLGIPAGSTDGAEVGGTEALSGGTVRARLQVADAPSSLTGFFLYAPPASTPPPASTTTRSPGRRTG
jgi:hypothetical protein